MSALQRQNIPVTSVGVLGGMFDPVHVGHLRAARHAITALGLDQVRLMPCSVPVHREHAAASDADRITMLELAVASDSQLVVDDRECRRDGPSWTVVSLESMHEEAPGTTLYLLMGADAFATLDTWHRWQELLTLCHLVIVGRPGTDPVYNPVLKNLLAEHEEGSITAMKQKTCGCIYTGLSSRIELSSTGVRHMLQQDDKVADLVPAAVLEYIDRHKLYSGAAE